MNFIAVPPQEMVNKLYSFLFLQVCVYIINTHKFLLLQRECRDLPLNDLGDWYNTRRSGSCTHGWRRTTGHYNGSSNNRERPVNAGGTLSRIIQLAAKGASYL